MSPDPTPRDEMVALVIAVLLTSSVMFGASIALCLLLQELGIIL